MVRWLDTYICIYLHIVYVCMYVTLSHLISKLPHIKASSHAISNVTLSHLTLRFPVMLHNHVALSGCAQLPVECDIWNADNVVLSSHP